MRNRIAVSLVVLLAVAFTAPGGMPAAAPTVEPQATPAPKAAPAPAKPLVVPEDEKARKNPVPNTPEALESGKTLYQSQCAMCHGKTGDGRGDLALSLKLTVPDVTDPQRQKRRTDGEWLYITTHGHNDMPAEKRLVDQQKWEIILYMRTLAKGSPPK
jgi:mono/diheme cytochrome c family protein